MPGKPFQSCLIPYQSQIADLRSQSPPVSYARIAAFLRDSYGLSIKRAAIAKFVKARSGGRKVYFFRREAAAKKSATAQAAIGASQTASLQTVVGPANTGREPPNPKFEFTYSDRYNLKRLPKEEAAAIRKKLEEEGH